MDSWLNASDSEIEDVNTARDLVTFENIQKYYSPYSNIVASYTLGESFNTQHRDWVGLFRSGWNDFNNYVDFQWASHDSFSHLLPRRRRVIFEAPHSKIECNKMNTFQFLYISSGNMVIGVSELFHILDLPKESELNFDLLENALMDDDEPVIVPEPFSGINTESSTNTPQSNFYLPYVANISLDLDQHNSVLALYSTNESFSKRLMKKEMPFATVQDYQIVEFFNPQEPQQKRNQPSWLQKIFTNTQPSVTMFENDEPSSKESQSDSSLDSRHPIKTSHQDSVTLCQNTFQDRSWMNDLQIVDRENVVENFYEYDHPFSQFGSVFLDESVEESKDFIASSVVDEFKTRMSGSFEHLESLFSDKEWQEVSDSEMNDMVKTNIDVLKPIRESNPSSSYDFSDDINLDILFHEKTEGKKSKTGHKSRRPKRKNKKSKKNQKYVTKEDEGTTSSEDISSSKTSITSLPIMSLKSQSRRFKKKQQKPKSKKRTIVPSTQQIPTEATEPKKLLVVPQPNRTETALPEKVSATPETSLAVVPYKPNKSFKVFQPFLSQPILSPPLLIEKRCVPFVPFSSQKDADIMNKSTPAVISQRRSIRIKFPYTKKHQSLIRSTRQSSGCYSCKTNRKMAATYKERYVTAKKQVEMFLKERADLQNQINAIKEELNELKEKKTTETQTVETLTTRVDDLVFIIPEVDGVIKSLDENNELLDLAFQSALVDNAQLRTDMAAVQESLSSLNKQFLETEREFKTTIQEIERKQSTSKTLCRSKWEKTPKRFLRLQKVVARKQRMIESLQERVNIQSLEITNNNDEMSTLKKTLESERQRANKAEAEKSELKLKMDAMMVAKQSTSKVEEKSTWCNVVVRQEGMKKPHVRFTVCDETTNQSKFHKSVYNQSKATTSSQSKLIEMSQSKAEFWKKYNSELKTQINEGLCRICGMSFSPFIDKRIIEEHITFHKQFQY